MARNLKLVLCLILLCIAAGFKTPRVKVLSFISRRATLNANKLTVSIKKRSNEFYVENFDTYEELENFVRKKFSKHKHNDFVLVRTPSSECPFVQGHEILSNDTWATMPVGPVLNVSIEAKSVPFATITSQERLEQLGVITEEFEIDRDFQNGLPKPRDMAAFEAACVKVADRLQDDAFMLGTTKSVDEKTSRSFIMPFLVYAGILYNNDTLAYNAHSATPIALECVKKRPLSTAGQRVALECNTHIAGTFAHGQLDYALYMQYFMLVALTAKIASAGADEPRKCQLIAQLLIARQRLQRVYAAAYPHWPAAQLQHLIDTTLPSYGIILSGKTWQFLKYHQDESSAWCAKWSKEYEVSLSIHSTVVSKAAQLEQVRALMLMVYGVLAQQMDSAKKMEAAVNRGPQCALHRATPDV